MQEIVMEKSIEENSELTPADEEVSVIQKSDLEWLDKVKQMIWQELENTDLNISNLAENFHLSRRQFQRHQRPSLMPVVLVPRLFRAVPRQ